MEMCACQAMALQDGANLIAYIGSRIPYEALSRGLMYAGTSSRLHASAAAAVATAAAAHGGALSLHYKLVNGSIFSGQQGSGAHELQCTTHVGCCHAKQTIRICMCALHDSRQTADVLMAPLCTSDAHVREQGSQMSKD